MAVRLLAASLLIVGLAGPVLDAGVALPGPGPLLLVIDDGWAAAADWPGRVAAADSMLARAAREHRPAALLATADANDARPPAISAGDAGRRSARAARGSAAEALAGGPRRGGGGLAPLGASRRAGRLSGRWPRHHRRCRLRRRPAPRRVGDRIAPDPPQTMVLLPPRAEPDRLVARLAQLPQPMAAARAVLAQSGDGRTLARATFTLTPGARTAEAAITLPPELRNRLARLVLEGPASAAGVALLDERWRRRPVGLMSPDAAANVPLSGTLYYLRRALSPFVELREGSIATLLKRQIAVIVLADEPLAPGADQTALTQQDLNGTSR